MSVRALKAFRGLDLTALEPGARFTLWAYCDMADDYTLEAWPSVPFLVRLTGMSERSVQRYLQHLVEQRKLEIVQRGGGKSATRYRLTIGLETYVPGALTPELKRALPWNREG